MSAIAGSGGRPAAAAAAFAVNAARLRTNGKGAVAAAPHSQARSGSSISNTNCINTGDSMNDNDNDRRHFYHHYSAARKFEKGEVIPTSGQLVLGHQTNFLLSQLLVENSSKSINATAARIRFLSTAALDAVSTVEDEEDHNDTEPPPPAAATSKKTKTAADAKKSSRRRIREEKDPIILVRPTKTMWTGGYGCECLLQLQLWLLGLVLNCYFYRIVFRTNQSNYSLFIN